MFGVMVGGCNFEVPKDPHTLVQNLPTDPERLNPIIANSAYAGVVNGFLFESLIDLDPQTLDPRPLIAKRWAISPDRLQYTFFLREDVTWHDGHPFTAEDVLFAYEKIKDPKSDAAPLRNYFKDVLKAEKIDDTTVRFTYTQPYVGALITLGLMRPMPRHIFEGTGDFNTHPANRAPVGNGPFRFVEWKTGSRILLERNEDYWGKPYAIRKILFKIIPDEIIAFRLFKKKTLDLIEVTPLQWARQTGTEKFRENFVKHNLFTPFGAYRYLGWNLSRPYFQDRRVRRALAHLVDREEINRKLLFGLYHVITGPYYPLGRNYNRHLEPMAYDLEKAKKLLAEAGWIDQDGDGVREKEGVPFKFTLLFSSGVQFYEQLTPILRRDFSQAGIQVELRRLEAVTLFKMMQEHDFDAYLAAWGRGAGEEDLYQIWHSSQMEGGSNYVRFANGRVDRLLEEGRREFDVQKRARLYGEVHKILYEEQPYLFMFARPELIARDNRFKNVREYPIGLEMREWVME
ncbi:MAG: peptide-binding protein [Deltaproteobacteria bacterium]|nr:peptide-binding protein [Deltaproteobacteria bacterium]